MGLFGNGKSCSICGGKAGLLSRMKLQDGDYVCADCQMKVSDQIRMDDYKQLTKADFEKCVKDTAANNKKYQSQFSETFAITAGSGHKVLSVDETHGWWVCPEYNRPMLFSLDEIDSWSVKMDTEADSDDNHEDKGLMDMFNQFAQSSYFASLRANHPELPYCPTGYHATGMKIYVSVSNPYIREAVIDIWKPGWFSDSNEDLQNAYNTAIQMIEYFQKVKKQDNAQLKTSGTSYQRMGQPETASKAASSDPTAELRKYKGLLDDGIITQDEFNAKKKQLLGL